MEHFLIAFKEKKQTTAKGCENVAQQNNDVIKRNSHGALCRENERIESWKL